ncbi:HAD-IIIC family phosphatase [Pantanalinema rosaneae CENA516]|uniref:HAD-IIIC family phosphatase n=1 Tax=Pantanalinema rosaneae TaxID=1620701 RepID=UPI003D6F2C47
MTMQAATLISSQNQTDEQMHLAIAATFTAEPIADTLSFWMQELAMPATIAFAPYNQIFQQLLAPSSLLASNRHGVNIICLRVADWCRFTQPDEPFSDLAAMLKRQAHDLVAALQAAVSASSTPYILCLCPASASLPPGSELAVLLQQTEAWLVDRLRDLKGLHLLSFAAVQALYPVAEYDDPQRDRLGHIPFTPEFFTALGTAIARKIYALKTPPHKVIVLDCDHTLWQGVVGEDGVHGLDVSAQWQVVQNFMVAQQQAGMLLCLCSKNNEVDVMQVFEQRQDMPLKLEHLVAWRINWLPKSENIKSLAAELNLGLESFIFIDDNPVECAEVGANCPEVLTLQLPIDGDMSQFLNHIWAFDHLQTTEVDAQRTALYQQNLERQRWQQQALTLEDFLSGLEMTIEIAEPTASQLVRVAQLTQRTNQFNFTTIRRTEAEIQQLMQAGMECRAVTVRDRFGDYGLVGVMLFSSTANAVHLDTFLLSCRVLGRGVEHQMIRYLAKYAAAYALNQIDLTYVPTAKNQPALSFLAAIAGEYQQANGNGYCFQLPVPQALTTTAQLGAMPPAVDTDREPQASVKPSLPTSQISKSQVLGRIAIELSAPQAILAAIQGQRRAAKLSVDKPFVFPRTSTENDLSALWSELLGIHPIGLIDNYFDLGGTSLQAVELFAQIEQYFGKRLPLTSLLEAPTIEELARLIDADSSAAAKTGQVNGVIKLNRSEGVTPPLFLIHPGGGDVLLYRNLAQRLQPTTTVYAIKPYSRNGYPIVHTQIPEMAAYYIEQMRAIQPEGPYWLGGFCVGGVIAVEMALQLQRQGVAVPSVALINAIDTTEKKRWEQVRYHHNPLKLLWWNLKAQFRMLLYRYSVAKLNHPPQFTQTMTVLSVCQMASAAYKPKRQFQGKLLLFKSRETILGESSDACDSLDALLGWGQRSTLGVKVYENAGDFEGILREPYVKELAEQWQSNVYPMSSIS